MREGRALAQLKNEALIPPKARRNYLLCLGVESVLRGSILSFLGDAEVIQAFVDATANMMALILRQRVESEASYQKDRLRIDAAEARSTALEARVAQLEGQQLGRKRIEGQHPEGHMEGRQGLGGQCLQGHRQAPMRKKTKVKKKDMTSMGQGLDAAHASRAGIHAAGPVAEGPSSQVQRATREMPAGRMRETQRHDDDLGHNQAVSDAAWLAQRADHAVPGQSAACDDDVVVPGDEGGREDEDGYILLREDDDRDLPVSDVEEAPVPVREASIPARAARAAYDSPGVGGSAWGTGVAPGRGGPSQGRGAAPARGGPHRGGGRSSRGGAGRDPEEQATRMDVGLSAWELALREFDAAGPPDDAEASLAADDVEVSPADDADYLDAADAMESTEAASGTEGASEDLAGDHDAQDEGARDDGASDDPDGLGASDDPGDHAMADASTGRGAAGDGDGLRRGRAAEVGDRGQMTGDGGDLRGETAEVFVPGTTFAGTFPVKAYCHAEGKDRWGMPWIRCRAFKLPTNIVLDR